METATHAAPGADVPDVIFLRPEGYARRISMSKRHVERLMRRGVLPFVKTGHRSIMIPIAKADAALLKLAVGGGEEGLSA
jgi:hypothetical protein